eukprot:509801_1
MNRVSKLLGQLRPQPTLISDDKHAEVMECIKRLVLEHKRMQRTLTCFDNMISHNEFPMSDVKDFLHFFRVYGDVMHHEKEETVLFTEIENTKPIVKMLNHHVRLRKYMGKILDRVANNDVEGVRRFGTEYTYFLRGHIQTENHSLWTIMMQEDTENRDVMHGVFEQFMDIDKKNEQEAAGLISLSDRLQKKWAPKDQRLRTYKLPQIQAWTGEKDRVD